MIKPFLLNLTSRDGFASQILSLRRAAQPPARYASLCRRYKVGCCAAGAASQQGVSFGQSLVQSFDRALIEPRVELRAELRAEPRADAQTRRRADVYTDYMDV